MKITVISQYLKIWWLFATHAWQETMVSRWSSLFFFLGKIVRLLLSLVFIWTIKTRVAQFGSYTSDQLVIFFLTYHWIDLVSQILFRRVYSFGGYIRSGNLDYSLARPIKPLFQALFGWPDMNDVIFLVPTIGITAWVVSNLSISVSLLHVLLFICLFLNGILIMAGLHVLVLASAIFTADTSGTVWLLRDITQLVQIPASLYWEPIKTVLFFVIPVGFAMTIPAQVLFGSTPPFSLLTTFLVGLATWFGSVAVWKQAIKQYSSASS